MWGFFWVSQLVLQPLTLHSCFCTDPFLLAAGQFPAAVSIEGAGMCQGSAHSSEVAVP